MNYRNIINKGTSILKNYSIPTADIDAELLLTLSLNTTREKILLNSEKKLNKSEINNYLRLINKRKNKEPISSICGKKFFWKYEFKINKNVLAPRFETELLVEEVLKRLKLSNRINVLDVGLGSGCILISLLKERKDWKGTGLDISSIAMKTAIYNAKIQQVYNRIKFVNSDIDKFYSSKYDLIVSNPPYINKIGYNNLNLGVKKFEPKLALYGGVDGLSVINKIIKKSKKILKKNGLIAMEVGFDQYYKVCELLRRNNFYVIKIVKDFQRINRCIFAINLNK